MPRSILQQIKDTLLYVQNNPNLARYRFGADNLVPQPLQFFRGNYNEHFFAFAVLLIKLEQENKISELIDYIERSSASNEGIDTPASDLESEAEEITQPNQEEIFSSITSILSSTWNSLSSFLYQRVNTEEPTPERKESSQAFIQTPKIYYLRRRENGDELSEEKLKLITLIERAWVAAEEACSHLEDAADKNKLGIRDFKKCLNRFRREQDLQHHLVFVKGEEEEETVEKESHKKLNKLRSKRAALTVALLVSFGEAMVAAVALSLMFGLALGGPVILFAFAVCFSVNSILFYAANKALMKDFFSRSKAKRQDGDSEYREVLNLFINAEGQEISKSQKTLVLLGSFFALAAGIASGCLAYNALLVGIPALLSIAFPPAGLLILAGSLSFIAAVALTALFHQSIADLIKNNTIKSWFNEHFIEVWGEKRSDEEEFKYWYAREGRDKVTGFVKGLFKSTAYALFVGVPLLVFGVFLAAPSSLLFRAQVIQAVPAIAKSESAVVLITFLTGTVESVFRLLSLKYLKDKTLSTLQLLKEEAVEFYDNPKVYLKKVNHTLRYNPEAVIMGIVRIFYNLFIAGNSLAQGALAGSAGDVNHQALDKIAPSMLSPGAASATVATMFAGSSHAANLNAAEGEANQNIIGRMGMFKANTAATSTTPAAISNAETTKTNETEPMLQPSTPLSASR